MAEQNQPEEVTQETTQEVQQIIPTQKTRDTVEEIIANQVIEKRKADGEIEETPDETPADTPEATEAAETTKVPEMVDVKVEGQVFSVPKEKVDAEGGVDAFQMKAAAELIFRRAKEREEQANKLLAAAKQHQPQQPVEPENKLVQAVEALRFNANPEEAARAVRELVGGNQLTPDQINQIADQRYAHRRAAEKFQEKYPDIMNDPILHGVAASLENQELAKGRRDFDVMFDQIGKHLSDWRGKLAGNFKEKEQKKTTITNIPQAKAKATLPDAPKEMTASEIIAQERRARKQA